MYIFITMLFPKAVFPQEIEIQNYKESAYSIGDTLKFSIKNMSSKKIKISLSMDLFYDGKWREIDNDIYQENPKAFHYFLISNNCRKRFNFPVAFIDSNYLKDTKIPKFRIILNIYKTHPFKLLKYNLNEFIINNTE